MQGNKLLHFDGSLRKSDQNRDFLETELLAICHALGATPNDNLVITASGEEALAQVFFSVLAEVVYKTGKNHFILNRIDSPMFQDMANYIEKLGCVISYIEPLPSGLITADRIRSEINPRTALVSLAWAHPLIGVIQPIGEISKVCRELGVLFHVDGTDVLPTMFWKFEHESIDYFTADGFRLGTKRLIGLLLSQPEAPLNPLIPGICEQPGRGGCLDREAVKEFSSLLTLLVEERDEVALEKSRLCHLFQELIRERLVGCIEFFLDVEKIPGISILGFSGIHSSLLYTALSEEGLIGNIGGSHTKSLSEIMIHLGYTTRVSLSTIQLSIPHSALDEDIHLAVSLLGQTIARLGAISYAIQGESSL